MTDLVRLRAIRTMMVKAPVHQLHEALMCRGIHPDDGLCLFLAHLAGLSEPRDLIGLQDAAALRAVDLAIELDVNEAAFVLRRSALRGLGLGEAEATFAAMGDL